MSRPKKIASPREETTQNTNQFESTAMNDKKANLERILHKYPSEQGDKITPADWTREDETALNYHENIIQKGLDTFIEVGQSLQAIRDKRLYRKDFATFEEYLKEKWQRGRAWANQLISSTEVVNILKENDHPGDHLPQTEKQARPLAKLKDNPELMAQVWEEALAEAKAQYEAGLKRTDQPTHKELEEKVKQYEAELKAKEERLSQLSMNFEHLNQTNKKLVKGIFEADEKLEKAKAEYEEKIETEKKLKEETERLVKERDEALSKLKSEEQKTQEALDKAKQDYQTQLEDYKQNPDPKTLKILEELERDKRTLENEVKLIKLRLEETQQQVNDSLSVGLTIQHFGDKVKKAISEHPSFFQAVSSPVISPRFHAEAESLANMFESWAVQIREALIRSQQTKEAEILDVDAESKDDYLELPAVAVEVID